MFAVYFTSRNEWANLPTFVCETQDNKILNDLFTILQMRYAVLELALIKVVRTFGCMVVADSPSLL